MSIMQIVQVMALDDLYIELKCVPQIKKKPKKVDFMDVYARGDLSLLTDAAHESQNHVFTMVVEKKQYDEHQWNVFSLVDIPGVNPI